jgi:hypothetical protein
MTAAVTDELCRGPVPPGGRGVRAEVRKTLQVQPSTQLGTYILENLDLEALARDRHYEFELVGIRLKLKGATGSPIRPLALVPV